MTPTSKARLKKSPPLTKKKREWAKNRDVALRGRQLNYNAAIQGKYTRELQILVEKMVESASKSILRLFKSDTGQEFREQQKEVAAMDESLSSQARILSNALLSKFSKLFALKAKGLAENMTLATFKVSKSTLHESLKQLTGGLSLKTGVIPKGLEEVANALIAENVSLIKSIPQTYLKNVTGAVMRSITQGHSVLTLTQEIAKYSKQSKRHVRLLALDQTRKAYNSINKQRMQAVGIKQFEWIHSGGGQHPRKSHEALSGKIFSFDDLPVINLEQVQKVYEGPIKGIPGQAINCKCTMRPVIKFEE